MSYLCYDLEMKVACLYIKHGSLKNLQFQEIARKREITLVRCVQIVVELQDSNVISLRKSISQSLPNL